MEEEVKSDDVREIIVKTEDDLRDLIDSILTRKHGTGWEDISQIGWSNTKKADLEGVKKSRMEKFPDKTHSNRLLDYSYIHHLIYLIAKNKELFKPVFSNIDRTLQLMDILAENRNLLMHSEIDVEEHQKYLCLGICGLLNQNYEKWKKGYRSKAEKWSCDMRVYQQKSTLQVNAEKLMDDDIQKIVEVIKNKVNGTVSENIKNDVKNIIISHNHNTTEIVIGKLTVGNFSSYGEYWIKNISIHTDDFDFIDEFLRENNVKYWTFSWHILEGLDAITTIENIERIRSMRHPGSQGFVDGKLVGKGIEQYFENNENRIVRANIMGGVGVPTTITLVSDKIPPDGGFTNVHNVFSPDEILTIMYGERTPNHVRKLIDNSF